MIGLKWIVAPGIQRNPHRITAFTTDPSIGVMLTASQWEQSYGMKVILVKFTGVIWAFMPQKCLGECNVKKTGTLQ